MPRIPRLFLPGHPFHIIQRGHNRAQVFFGQEDAKRYLGWLAEGAVRYGVAVHAYVLMTNHLHLLVSPETAQSLPLCMRHVNWRYSSYANAVRASTSSPWEGRYRASMVDADSYFFACSRYIELNPVRAGMAAEPGAYRWSSYRANAEGKADPLIAPHELYTALGPNDAARAEAYRALFEGALGTNALASIRATINSGRALGSNAFITLASRHAGHSMAQRNRGRPSTKAAR